MYKMSGVRRYLSPAPLRGFFFGARLTRAGVVRNVSCDIRH
jgi:hypothetical protein